MPAFPAPLPLLLAFDLDGTLLPELGQSLSAELTEALHAWKRRGAMLAIITGRDTVPQAVRQAVPLDAVATNNGGRLELRGVLQQEATFEAADLRAVLAHELADANIVLFTREQLYVGLAAGVEPEAWMLARGFLPLEQAPEEGILKVGFYHHGVANHAARLRLSHPHLVVTGAQDPYPNFLTVTPAGANKAAALTLMAQAFEIPLSHTVAFGDSDNDEGMLELAGFAVQVGTLPLLRPHATVTVEQQTDLAAYLLAECQRYQSNECVS